ncbi:AAA family ATPase [Halomonas elongata]|uniref:ATP-binding protein n=1 Tax=Halomonas elongata (strain ATCC 33173 / DSM 2581 / NBRC 15536 / NCIMB 2198 / 1H9) TaxID=768066 RepID=A0A1R4A4H8_HALED|nr:ATP-binding protein [Halomonas elongata]WBF17717.1 ATP-binding protein [Halomonas elongata]WPU46558.1 ATP-binding protein [Halomonas elongata DSM 2581]SJK83875.1 uncharacterized protein HELO_4083B [Halomonas elongata DSM 2581]
MEKESTLHVLCGKLASGKTTLAEELAAEASTVLISEDLWLSKLFPDEISGFQDYLNCSARLRSAIGQHVQGLLREGISVVFDFAGNTPQERAWAKSLCGQGRAQCVLHYLEASDELCKLQLLRRNEQRPEGSQVTTVGDFDSITKYFVPPSPNEGLKVQSHDAASRHQNAER